MKRALTIAMATALALPLFAEDAKKPEQTTAQAQSSDAAHDSPMVAAAKRSKRQAKTSPIVITNATLKDYHANARITTTTSERSLNVPEPVVPRDTPAPKKPVAIIGAVPAEGATKKADADPGAKTTPPPTEATDLDYNPRDMKPEDVEKLWREASKLHETDPARAEELLREMLEAEEGGERPPRE